ncbi:MAG: pilus assembly protein CpaC [Alphaproteobacteria bacterium]|jgi:pilus assembly protein CpaC|nr:pilus assembly protein CpaC [Alphaproteobacteria bacterium]
MGGEIKVKNGTGRQAAAFGQRHAERLGGRRGAGEDRNRVRRLLATVAGLTIAAAAVTVLPIAAGDAQAAERLIQISGAKRTVSITVTVGKTEDVRIDSPFTDITVGDPEVADVTPLTDHAISILGKKIGTTRVAIYSEGKKQIGILDVEVSYDITRLSSEIRTATGANIRVSSVNGRIMLSGMVPDAVTLDKAVQIARQFAPDTNAVINTVQIASPQQVMLEVRFIEAKRNAGRDLGVQWNIFNSKLVSNIGSRKQADGTARPDSLPITAPTSPLNIPVGEVAAGVLSGGSPFGFMLGRIMTGGTTIDVLINALEQKGVARTLAEPNLVALSGDTASFLAGGEYPYPVPSSLGSFSIEWKRYGVMLAFTPTVLKDGVINLKIEPEVSQLDTSHPVTILGTSVPPLISRRANTTIELRDGQSFMLGGLLLNVGTTAQEQLPWVGDMPVLGALFRSASYQKNETDLAIIVTPRIVRPARPGDVIKSPLDNRLPPNDVDLFLMGKGEVSPREAVLAASQRYVGHILDLPKKGGAYVSVKN